MYKNESLLRRSATVRPRPSGERGAFPIASEETPVCGRLTSFPNFKCSASIAVLSHLLA